MNFRLTMVLAILLLLIVSVFVWTNMPKNPDDNKNQTPKNALMNPQPKDIQSISYSRDGAVQVAFEKTAGKWQLTAPVAAAAETYQMEILTDMLKGLAFKDKFSPEPTGQKSEDATGLKSPHSLVEFTDDAGKKHMLALGQHTVGGVYARLDGGQTIYLLDSDPLEKLDKDSNEFRSKTMLEVATDKVTKLQIATETQTVELSKGAEGKWVIDRPIPARANATVVNDLLAEFKTLRAVGFTRLTTQTAVGMNPAAVTVTATVDETPSAPTTGPSPATAPAKSTKNIALHLGYYTDPVQKKAVYAAVEGSNAVFTLASESFNKLNKTLNDLRDPAITPAAVSDASHVSITQGSSVLSLTRTTAMPPTWFFVTSAAAGQAPALPIPAGTLEVANLLTNLKNLRAIKYVDNAGDLKSIGLDPPQSKYALQVPGQSQEEVILVGKPEAADKVTPVMRQGEPTVYLVQTGDAEKVSATPLSLRDKVIDRLSADRIREIAFAGPAAKAQTVLHQGTSWQVVSGGKTAKVDDSKATELLALFTPITASKWLSTDGAKQLKSAPDVEITISLREDAPAATTGQQPLLRPSVRAWDRSMHVR